MSTTEPIKNRQDLMKFKPACVAGCPNKAIIFEERA